MNIYKNKLVSRFGLMHMIATNICNWLNVLILETEHSIAGIGGTGVHNHQTKAGLSKSNHSTTDTGKCLDKINPQETLF